jgi:Histidine kinase-, DNA gyrase B-, and HSP90-like ATPase
VPPPDSQNPNELPRQQQIAQDQEQFNGQILVSSRIIDELSSGLYETPAACLKELVNNAYDADATEVVMSVRPDADVIIINDNGTGLSRETFEGHFKRIAESRKREVSGITASGRPMVGRIGIGFVAANEICDRMDIFSTVSGSREVLEVSIDFANMRIDPAERRKNGGDLAKGDYHGMITPMADLEEHYTRIYLRNIRGPAQDVLAGAEEGHKHNSLYGLKPSSVRERLADPNLKSWDEFDSYSQAMLEIALNVPVRYHDSWLPKEYAGQVRPFVERAAALNFDVVLDGTSLRKPIVLKPGPDGTSLLRVFEIKGERVGAVGYFYAAGGKISPADLNGILIRIRNAGVGGYDGSFLGYPSWINPLFQGWASCEVYADDRLEQSQNIDRKTLRTTDFPYVEIRNLLHEKLKEYFGEVRLLLYQERSVRRNQERAREQSRQLDEIKDRLTPSLGESSANDLVDRLRAPKRPHKRSERSEPNRGGGTSKSGPAADRDEPEINVKVLNAKYTAVQVIEMVAKAATSTGLAPEITKNLLSEVARQLSA